MPTELPEQADVKDARLQAWQEETAEYTDRQLAELRVSQLGWDGFKSEAEAINKWTKRFNNYSRKQNAAFPKLEYTVDVERVLQTAKGKVYRLITRLEHTRLQDLESLVGELPLKYIEDNELFYGNEDKESETELSEDMTLGDFDFILNSRQIHSGELAAAIGKPAIKVQKIATLRRMARDEERRERKLPADIAPELVSGLKKLARSRGETADVQKNEEAPVTTKATAKEVQVPDSGLRIVGLGGIDIPITTKLNLENFPDCRIVDDQGNVLIQGDSLHIPPITLPADQQEIIRRLIAEAVTSKIKIG